MARNWKDFKNDELFGIWTSYVRTEFSSYDDLNNISTYSKEIRLTPLEIIKLVEELMDRLDIKQKNEENEVEKGYIRP